MAYPSEHICLPYACSVVDVSNHDYYGGSHPHTDVYSGMGLDSALVGTDYEAYLSASLTSCAVGACCAGRVCVPSRGMRVPSLIWRAQCVLDGQAWRARVLCDADENDHSALKQRSVA